jgi:hypothetical protein
MMHDGHVQVGPLRMVWACESREHVEHVERVERVEGCRGRSVEERRGRVERRGREMGSSSCRRRGRRGIREVCEG